MSTPIQEGGLGHSGQKNTLKTHALGDFVGPWISGRGARIGEKNSQSGPPSPFFHSENMTVFGMYGIAIKKLHLWPILTRELKGGLGCPFQGQSPENGAKERRYGSEYRGVMVT